MNFGTEPKAGLRPRIGIIAPSSKIPQVELKLGIRKIQEVGFSVDVHPQCKKSFLFFSGTDLQRAEALFDYAADSRHDVLWCGRGGYGAIRLLPILQKFSETKGVPPKKLLIGYSDATALMDFTRREWGWSTLHAPMPTLRKFSLLGDSDWAALQNWIQGKRAIEPWKNQRLKFWSHPPRSKICGTLVGGNLTVWNSLTGTPFQPSAQDSFLFFEDIDESLYRIDRMLQQMVLSGCFSRTRAILLGNFLNCQDHSPSVLKKLPPSSQLKRVLTHPKPEELQLLRKPMAPLVGLRTLFTELGNQLKIPVAFGLPVGHGPEVSPLPLGANYELTPQGHLRLLQWDWIRETQKS